MHTSKRKKNNRRKIVKLRMYSHSITRPPPVRTCMLLNWPLSPLLNCIFLQTMCETAESSNMQQKHNVSRFCLPIIYKIKNFIYTTIVFQLSMIPHLHHVSTKKTQFTLLKKIKSFVVFKMNEWQLVVISSDE